MARTIDDRYRAWRRAVLEADHYTCQACLSKDPTGRTLECHHIRNYRGHPERRYDVTNGIVLCKRCHERFHDLFNNWNNDWEQVRMFLDGFKLERTLASKSPR